MKHSSGNIMHYLKLVRYQNLLIVILTQIIVKFFIINKLCEHCSMLVSYFDFSLIVLTTVLIGAAGYAINDYFDIQIDRINKPDKVLINKYIPRRNAIIIHAVFNIIAVITTMFLAYQVRSLTIFAFMLFFIASLWLYSIKYKKVFLLGNLIVSANIAFAILAVAVYEFYAILNSNIQTNIMFLQITLVVAAFAFIINFSREIIKDIEDIKGDMKYNCNTLPIKLGVKNAKAVTFFIILTLIFGIMYLSFKMNFVLFLNIFVYSFIIFPLLYSLLLIFKAKDKNDFRFISALLKLIMLSGILSMVILGI
ncbi:MAG: hypothetical protein A2X12_02660 [Bacteroidetes bacterium GWE2_29_8]|nr:MAG: hypothetical protein A2X12_02660 [Bacteroidetes bacterium GWE2_29_8]OFY22205.1 MAG: hypothetical protein A2X02_00060 [Bacteroidetes bacterium GWF2_29_10]